MPEGQLREISCVVEAPVHEEKVVDVLEVFRFLFEMGLVAGQAHVKRIDYDGQAFVGDAVVRRAQLFECRA